MSFLLDISVIAITSQVTFNFSIKGNTYNIEIHENPNGKRFIRLLKCKNIISYEDRHV